MAFHSLSVRQPPPGHIARISMENKPGQHRYKSYYRKF